MNVRPNFEGGKCTKKEKSNNYFKNKPFLRNKPLIQNKPEMKKNPLCLTFVEDSLSIPYISRNVFEYKPIFGNIGKNDEER